MQDKKYGKLTSSVDPSSLSATITGIIIAFSSLLVAVAATKGVAITEAQVSVAAGQIGAAIGAIYTLFGLGRKIIAFFAKK